MNKPTPHSASPVVKRPSPLPAHPPPREPPEPEDAKDSSADSLAAKLEKLYSWFLPPDKNRKWFGTAGGVVLAGTPYLAPLKLMPPATLFLSASNLLVFGLFLAWRITPREQPALQAISRDTIPPSRSGNVCVFHPDPELDPEHKNDAFYEDGQVQKLAFVAAKELAMERDKCAKVDFCGMRKDATASELLKTMQRRYEGGHTFFIMTMSSKISALQKPFSEWHRECKREGHPAPPVLVATVASAPNLAGIDGGIVRWYVRSQEESAELARYVKTKFEVCHSLAFLLDARPAFNWESEYAKEAAKAFQQHFATPDGRPNTQFLVSKATAREQVKSALARCRTWGDVDLRRTTAFVVGYGEMVRETLEALVENDFPGPIACTSTLTQPRWQPAKSKADERIFTVSPKLRDGGPMEGQDREVVYFFAKNTLLRVLLMTQGRRTPAEFLERWANKDFGDTGNPRLSEEVELNGDIRVDVEVLDHRRWRYD